MTPDLLGKIYALLTAVTWAIAVILFKKSGEKIPPIALNLYKTTIAILFFTPIVLIGGLSKGLEGLQFADIVLLFISGLVGIAIADHLFFKSLNMIGAGLTAIIDCVYSPMTIILSFLFLSESIGLSVIIGSSLVVIAVGLGAYKKSDKTHEKHILSGMFYGIAGIFLMVIGVIIMKPILNKTTVYMVAEIRFLSGFLGILFLISLRKNRRELINSVFHKTNFKYALPATILGNVISMTMWISAFKLTNINIAVILNQTNTIFITIFAAIFLKEKFTLKKTFATIFAFLGAIIVILY